jgi:hypothetical protein
VMEVGDSVTVGGGHDAATVPCLRGDAVELAEALSLRGPMPKSAPIEWVELLGGLITAFDAT